MEIRTTHTVSRHLKLYYLNIYPNNRKGLFVKNIVFLELTDGLSGANIKLTSISLEERSHAFMKQFAAYFFSYFYFFGFGAKKVKVFFAANRRLPSVA